ncbi:helix-turn-helix domain-containing protein [Archaeoglobus profundus]|uniref:Rrf2 family transcriptional regulator n=1 Tax=Archaeoglobus profundus TaxID=84156 RepID=UPI0011D08E50|nr:Rrf2 family transcriptional regulator [Archaeoglobus profundus]
MSVKEVENVVGLPEHLVVLRTKKKGEAVYKQFRRNENVIREIIKMRSCDIKEIAEKLNTNTLTILIIVGRLKQAGIIREVRVK